MNAEPQSQHLVLAPETANVRPELRLPVVLVTVATVAAAITGAFVTARRHAASHDAGGVTIGQAPAAHVMRLGAVRAEGEAALRCAVELRALAHAHPATTARAVRVDPVRTLICAGDEACLTPATMAAIDEGASALATHLRRLDAGDPSAHDLALDLVAARAHATASELCTARDVATTLAMAPRRAR